MCTPSLSILPLGRRRSIKVSRHGCQPLQNSKKINSKRNTVQIKRHPTGGGDIASPCFAATPGGPLAVSKLCASL
jgi:hypothetical protein